jgi:hypothetical protein
LRDFRLVEKGSRREAKMEELFKTHKDTPFGWVLLLQELAHARRARKAAAGPWREPALTSPPGDLHHLAAPH